MIINHHISQIESNAERHSLRLIERLILSLKLALDLDGALNGLNNATEIRQHGVARPTDDATMMARNESFHQFTALLEPHQCAVLIGAHQLAIADNIRAKNRRQFSFYSVCHNKALKRTQYKYGSLLYPYRPSHCSNQLLGKACDGTEILEKAPRDPAIAHCKRKGRLILSAALHNCL
jgi:hypothetical protein